MRESDDPARLCNFGLLSMKKAPRRSVARQFRASKNTASGEVRRTAKPQLQ